jgi:steroid 5-alpha reductase family enzyme
MSATTVQELTLLSVNVAAAVVLFAIVWGICVRVKNYGFLDIVWTLTIGLLALVDGIFGRGDVPRRTLFTLVGLAWSLRLGLFVLIRVLRHHPAEDKRYRSLRERWRTPGAFLAFFELQALIAVVFATPFLLAAFAPDPRMAGLEWLGLGIAAAGIIGEAIADRQSAAFKRYATGERRILDVGLWRYSRHPNYFFEILVWIGFAVASLPLPLGPLAIACPVLITYFLVRVTGVPLTEQHSLETHGEAYRDYQRRTSAIIPWAPNTQPGRR